MKKLIEAVYSEYKKKEIERGFITYENIDWLTEKLGLRSLTNKELSAMWEAVDEYFENIMAEYDESGKVIGWKPFSEETELARDSDSAWKEVVNIEARRRKAAGTL